MAIGALEQALQTGDVDIPSAEVLRSIMDCVVDAKGKILAGPRGHDEDMILAGWALAVCQTLANSLQPPRVREQDTSMGQFREALKREFGRDVLAPRLRPPGELDLNRA